MPFCKPGNAINLQSILGQTSHNPGEKEKEGERERGKEREKEREREGGREIKQ